MGVLINEIELIDILHKTKKALLLEPNYTRKYMPLGLAKLATAIQSNGGTVRYSREWVANDSDAIFCTSLFTYNSQEVRKAITGLQVQVCQNTPIYVGGVYASLMPDHLLQHTTANVFVGCSNYLDSIPPDYEIDWKLNDPWDKFSYCFTSRGCVNKCAYCAVWRLEPSIHVINNWKDHIDLNKPYIMISDNNLSSQSEKHVEDVVKFIYDNKKTTLFNNGFDCKYITADIAKSLGKLKYIQGGGMRVAFDRIEEDGIFQDAVRLLLSGGIKKSKILAFILFNFQDTPQEANYRATECLKLGIRPYPQQYYTLNCLSQKDKYIDKYWTENLVSAFRYFWLMAGYYTKMTFVQFIQHTDRYTLTDEEWEKWYYTK